MILHQDFTLIILASLASYFTMHEGSHLTWLSAGHARLNPTLALLMVVEKYASPVFLIWYGWKTVWYYPMLLMVICFLGTIVLVTIERALKLTQKAWIISISGILFVPVLFYFMFVHVNTVVS